MAIHFYFNGSYNKKSEYSGKPSVQVMHKDDFGGGGDPMEINKAAQLRHDDCQGNNGKGVKSRFTATKEINLKWGQIVLIVLMFLMVLIFLVVAIVLVVLKLLI